MQLLSQHARTATPIVAPIVAVLTLIGSAPSTAQTCPFDDGNSTITREGLVLTRFALGMSGAQLVQGTDFTVSDSTSIANTINCPSCGLDINGNGAFDVVDATIITRKLAGLTGSALTDGLALGSGSRNTTAAVQSFLTSGCGLAAAGSVRPGYRKNNSLSPAGAGKYSSLAIGFDGLPIIAFYNQTAGDLQVAKCATIDCASANIVTVDSAGDVGRFPSIVISQSGNPIIAYYDATNTALKTAFCTDTACAASATIVTVDATNNVGQYASLSLLGNLPTIAYYDATNRDLKLAECFGTACNSPTVRTLASTGDVGEWSAATSVQSFFTERTAVAYYDATNRQVRLARCSDNPCSTVVNSLIEALGTDSAEGIAITTGRDGNPVLSYTRKNAAGDGTGRIVICNNISCTVPIIQSVGTTGNTNSTGSYTSISIAPEGLPFAVFGGLPTAPCVNGNASGTVAYNVKCTNADCSTYLTGIAGDADALSPSVTHGIDGMPIWSAWSCGGGTAANGGNLMTVHCASVSCPARSSNRPR